MRLPILVFGFLLCGSLVQLNANPVVHTSKADFKSPAEVILGDDYPMVKDYATTLGIQDLKARLQSNQQLYSKYVASTNDVMAAKLAMVVFKSIVLGNISATNFFNSTVGGGSGSS